VADGVEDAGSPSRWAIRVRRTNRCVLQFGRPGPRGRRVALAEQRAGDVRHKKENEISYCVIGNKRLRLVSYEKTLHYRNHPHHLSDPRPASD
jgi:hypothetical protein